MKTISVMILDDHEIILQGVSQILKTVPAFNIAGLFTKSRDLVNALLSQSVDVIVLDYSLSPKDIDGLSLIRMLKRRNPETKILIFSANNSPVTIKLALRAGADGFFTKTSEVHQLSKAIIKVSLGKSHLPPEIEGFEEEVKQPPTITEPSHSEEAKLVSLLTEREREVLLHFLDGMSVIQISQKVARSRKTVSGHKRSAYQKLGIRTDSELFKMRFLIK